MSTTVSSSTKKLVEGGNSLAAFAGRRRPGMSSRKKMTSNGSIYRLPAEFNPDAPIYGASPNNADHDHIYHPDWNSVQPAPSAHPQGPQTRQRRLLLGSPSLTGFLRTLGSPNGADTPSPPHTSNGSANGHGGSNEALNPRSTAASRPSHIDLNEENHRSRDTPRVGVKNSAPYFEVPRTHSPEKYRCSPTTSARQRLNQVPEEMEVPSSSVVADGCGTYSDQRPQTSTAGQGHQYYGSVGCGPAPRTRSDVDPGTGPRYVEGVLMDDDDASSLSSEEEEWLLDSELAKEGLYRGNYKNLIILYTLVPLSTLLAFVLLAILPVLAFPSSSHSLFPYPPYLPFPIPEVSTAMALWSLSYLIRDFLYSTSLVATSWIPPPSYRFPKFIPVLTSILSAFLQSVSTIFFRQLAIPLLLIPYYSTELSKFQLYGNQELQPSHFPTWHDNAFRRVWWVALGWAAAEAIVGIKQGYESIALYKDVLVDMQFQPTKQAEGTTRQDNMTRYRSSEIDLPDLNVGVLTLVQSRAAEHHNLDSTPTQRDWPARQGILDVNAGHIRQSDVPLAPVPERRDYSRSLSSLSTRSDAQLDPVSDAAGERRPLLNTDSDPIPLMRQQTDESQRLLVENAVERDLEELITLKTREELEEVYGIPVIRIPVFISCLHRINSIISSLGMCLILSAAYMKSTFAYRLPSVDPSLPPVGSPPLPSNRNLFITLPALLVLQTMLAMVHTPWILPKIGIPTFVYISLLIFLGVFFGGLGIWEVLT